MLELTPTEEKQLYRASEMLEEAVATQNVTRTVHLIEEVEDILRRILRRQMWSVME